jgi:hypothetical protein
MLLDFIVTGDLPPVFEPLHLIVKIIFGGRQQSSDMLLLPAQLRCVRVHNLLVYLINTVDLIHSEVSPVGDSLKLKISQKLVVSF